MQAYQAAVATAKIAQAAANAQNAHAAQVASATERRNMILLGVAALAVVGLAVAL